VDQAWPRQLTPELPVALERLILRMLAKCEADRPQSMEAVAAELGAIANASGVVAVSSAWASPEVMASRDDGRAWRSPAATTQRSSAGEVRTIRVRPLS
jgi:hypothetical protein